MQARDDVRATRKISSNYQTSDYLKTPEGIATYIEAVLEEDEQKLLLAALRDVTEFQANSKTLKTVT